MRQIYEFGDFRLDPAEQLLLHEGQPVALAPKVFETLLILLNSDGRLIDKDEFIGQLWPNVFVEDVALAQNISQLRKALSDGKNGSQMIQTVPKRGYRLLVPVNRVTVEERTAEVKRSQIANGAAVSLPFPEARIQSPLPREAEENAGRPQKRKIVVAGFVAVVSALAVAGLFLGVYGKHGWFSHSVAYPVA
jgi:DNA-binding winged helix-turn-helix (wHTH) protein